MKKLIKVLSVLVIALTITLLSGCDPEKFNNLASYEIDLNINLDNKIELTGIYPNSGMSNSDFKDSYTTRYYEELTGYKVNYGK